MCRPAFTHALYKRVLPRPRGPAARERQHKGDRTGPAAAAPARGGLAPRRGLASAMCSKWSSPTARTPSCRNPGVGWPAAAAASRSQIGCHAELAQAGALSDTRAPRAEQARHDACAHLLRRHAGSGDHGRPSHPPAAAGSGPGDPPVCSRSRSIRPASSSCGSCR
jgi:hypothetical protein